MWDECLDLVIALGKAFVDNNAMKNYTDAINNAPNNLKPILTLLAEMFGLARLQEVRSDLPRNIMSLTLFISGLRILRVS